MKYFRDKEYYQNKDKTPKVFSAQKPKFSFHRGRTWDYCYIKLINGETVKGYLDTSWGNWIYFEGNDGKWHKINILCCHNLSDNDIDLAKAC